MSPEETYVLLRIREGMSAPEAAEEAGLDDGPTNEASALYRRTIEALDAYDTTPERHEPFITQGHRRRLDKLTAKDEQWDTFAGHLFDPESERGTICPEGMVEYLATRFAFTSSGRLFFLEEGGEVIERATGRGIFSIKYHGERWQPTVKAMLARMFPEVLIGEYEPDWSEPIEERPDWMEHLSERVVPEGAPIKRRTPTEDELDVFGYIFTT